MEVASLGGASQPKGFPFEGKLSPKATDEVEKAEIRKKTQYDNEQPAIIIPFSSTCTGKLLILQRSKITRIAFLGGGE